MKSFLTSLAILVFAQFASAQAKVMNPGEAVGQLNFLSVEDVTSNTAKFQSLSPLSIPVFAELPVDMSVVAGAMTLKQQTLLSHIQLKSIARHTPNLDISGLEGGMSNALFSQFKDGDWIHMVLKADGTIFIEPSTEAAAVAFYNSKQMDPIKLKADMSAKTVIRSQELSSADAIRVGTKAANYAELGNLLNTADRTIVRPGFGVPFHFYQEFIDMNPKIKSAVESILRDPLMNKVAKVSYRENKLKALRELMTSEEAVVSDALVQDLLAKFDTMKINGISRKFKLRSSTNSEDLPNFNGAGLYDSASYSGSKKGVEKSDAKKAKDLKEILKFVWASVWNLRAYDERAYFRIPHSEVRMGIQINLSFPNEGSSGVVVTKNVAQIPELQGKGVYIEVQRGSDFTVTNPVAGVKPQKILVLIDKDEPLNVNLYKINILQNSNIADDNKTLLPNDNPTPVMTNEEIIDLTLQVMKAHFHFKQIVDPNDDNFSLDLEFKVDAEDTGKNQIYLKQARPYID